MSHQPPNGALSIAQPDRRAGVARAGFVCGLISASASLLAGLNFLAQYLLIFNYRLHIFADNHFPGGTQPGLTSGEVVLLILAAFPVALVGLSLSILGRRSTSRRRLARAGIILSLIALIPFCILVVVLYMLFSYCSAHSCF